ncbi:MAG: hypothetical protein AABX08_00690 [Nanoarchaeota archaeon]
MATITVLQKPNLKKIRVDIDLEKWEQLADVFGFYKSTFLQTLAQSIKESKTGKVTKIKSLKELR